MLKIDYNKLMLNAFEDLQKVSDPYQHGMLAVALAQAVSGKDIEIPADHKENLENAPKMKKSKKKLESKTPAGEKIAQVMTEAANKTEAKNEAEEEIKLQPVDPPKAEAPDAEAPAPAPAAAPASDESYYDSEEWANKELTSDEFDDTWTPRMQKNKPLVETYKKLLQLVGGCVKNKDGSQNVNGTKWLDNAITKVTSGNITSYKDQTLYAPKMVKTTYCSLMMEWNALIEAVNQRKAA